MVFQDRFYGVEHSWLEPLVWQHFCLYYIGKTTRAHWHIVSPPGGGLTNYYIRQRVLMTCVPTRGQYSPHVTGLVIPADLWPVGGSKLSLRVPTLTGFQHLTWTEPGQTLPVITWRLPYHVDICLIRCYWGDSVIGVMYRMPLSPSTQGQRSGYIMRGGSSY